MPLHARLARRNGEPARTSLTPDEIDEVVVTIPEAGVSLVLEPANAKTAPRTEYEGKFSLQYSTAAMLVHGRVGVQTYTEEALADPATLELAKRVRYESEGLPHVPDSVPGRRPHPHARRQDARGRLPVPAGRA